MTVPLDSIWLEMIREARSVRRSRRLSGYVDAGSVAAAVLGASGRIYTGVCIDTSCTLGICAERNALFHMITCGEKACTRMLALREHTRILPPCGACREFLMQLMPETGGNIQILLSYPEGRVATLRDLMPDWWNSDPGRK